jgi:uncharacterized protein (TIGR02145 family)
MRYLTVLSGLLISIYISSCSRNIVDTPHEDDQTETKLSILLDTELEALEVDRVEQKANCGLEWDAENECSILNDTVQCSMEHEADYDECLELEISYYSSSMLLLTQYINFTNDTPYVYSETRDSINIHLRAKELNNCAEADSNCLYDTRNNKTYRTTTIAGYEWMAENLNYPIEEGRYSFCYENKEENCELYGRLYTWHGAMDGTNRSGARGVCPLDWHVPTDEEWGILEVAMGMDSTLLDSTGFRGVSVADNLLGYTRFSAPWLRAVEGESEFQAIGGGFYEDTTTVPNSVGFGRLGQGANFWTSTLSTSLSGAAIKRKVGLEDGGVYRGSFWQTNGYSLRCVREVD